MLIALMLRGSTEEYVPMRTAIENSNINLTTYYVKTKLLQMDVDKSIHIQHSIISQRKRKHGLESHVGK
jgi:predicted GNAT family acetyltransferase